MSEETTNTNEFNESTPVDIIVPEALLDIRMSSGFYNRVRVLLQNLINDNIDQIENAHEQIKSKDIKDAWVYDYETLLILCKDFESKAKDLGFVKSVPYAEAIKLMNESPDEADEVSSTDTQA